MTTYDLNSEQLDELKQAIATERADGRPSYGDLVFAPLDISDNEVHEHFAGVEFVPEDFAA